MTQANMGVTKVKEPQNSARRLIKSTITAVGLACLACISPLGTGIHSVSPTTPSITQSLNFVIGVRAINLKLSERLGVLAKDDEKMVEVKHRETLKEGDDSEEESSSGDDDRKEGEDSKEVASSVSEVEGKANEKTEKADKGDVSSVDESEEADEDKKKGDDSKDENDKKDKDDKIVDQGDGGDRVGETKKNGGDMEGDNQKATKGEADKGDKGEADEADEGEEDKSSRFKSVIKDDAKTLAWDSMSESQRRRLTFASNNLVKERMTMKMVDGRLDQSPQIFFPNAETKAVYLVNMMNTKGNGDMNYAYVTFGDDLQQGSWGVSEALASSAAAAMKKQDSESEADKTELKAEVDAATAQFNILPFSTPKHAESDPSEGEGSEKDVIVTACWKLGKDGDEWPIKNLDILSKAFKEGDKQEVIRIAALMDLKPTRPAAYHVMTYDTVTGEVESQTVDTVAKKSKLGLIVGVIIAIAVGGVIVGLVLRWRANRTLSESL
eukprot:GHVN01029633.1.p1 GENE.GHVN01029633.1~~GHVN01029633.1.p1  ORF type:complete len:496 (+),score=141.21 GHVN01029633.1:678-2165(+)